VGHCAANPFCNTDERPGSVEEYFNNHYARICESALLQFCNAYWPCEYQNRKGIRCRNFKTSHLKGHQDEKGHFFGSGTYSSAFRPELFNEEWLGLLKSKLQEMDLSLPRRSLSGNRTEREDVVHLHKQNMKQFYSHLEASDHYYNHATCFSCLIEVPQYPLPCGHVLCLSCVKDYDTHRRDLTIIVDTCPLHAKEALGDQPSLIRLKPDFAGVRVLCLDG
jgi:hypothetical protein